jgi:hypothetical protein
MNERILKLAEETRCLTGWSTDRVELEQFALLIVEECASLIENTCEDPRLKQNMDPDVLKLVKNIGKSHSNFIKEHFGIKIFWN